jgi:hypothetical protein
MSEPIHIISLGAGVQSSTMALMAAAGEITPMPQCAIFADTQAEPASVYKWLDWLEKQLPFPVHRVTAGSLEAEALRMKTTKDGRVFARTDIPFFTKSADGELGKITHRSCTADYKIKPIMKAARKIGGIKRGQKTVGVIQWIGISTDEKLRMKESRDPWAKSRWPLIELRMSRACCLRWMEQHGYPQPPRSSCVFCPFHNNAEWRRLQVEEPGEFAKAVEFEKKVQAVKAATDNFDTTPYLHKRCKPLDSVDFRSDIERGQKTLDWQDECTGYCGN